MTIEEIQAKLDAIACAMCDKGLVAPEATFRIKSQAGIVIMTQHGIYPNNSYVLHDSIDAAFAWVAALPSPEDAHRAEFLRLAAAAADYAEKHMPDDAMAAEVRASIVAGMRRLSDNAITKQDA